jgi:hypothetical protein
MWPNNGFQGHGDFQQGQGNFQQNYSDDGYISFSPIQLGQQYFQNPRPSQGIPYNDLSNSEQSTPGEFQPEVGLYNEESFAHSQFRGSNGPVSIVTSDQGFVCHLRPSQRSLLPLELGV